MARIIGLLVLFLATLTLGGCAGMPLDYGNGASGYGYGGSCPQPYGAMNPGCAAAAPAIIYVPQPQPYYAPQPYAYYNGATAYAPAPLPPQAGPTAGPWIDHRERDQAARIHQGRRDGSLTPREAQRQWAEQGHSRGAEGRMSADGNRSPYERSRLNAMPNRANQDLYGARHNGMGQPGATGPQAGNGPVGPRGSMGQPGAPVAHPGNGHAGPMNSMGQPQSNGAQTHRPMQPQARPTQPGVAPSGSMAATPGQ